MCWQTATVTADAATAAVVNEKFIKIRRFRLIILRVGESLPLLIFKEVKLWLVKIYVNYAKNLSLVNP